MAASTAPGLGHNKGPTMEPGTSWRKHCWTKARSELLGQRLPVEIIRGRVRRAAEIGLDYTTYASIRATSGHDVVAILFSSNALRVFRAQDVVPARAEKLGDLVRCDRTGLAIAPVSTEVLLRQVPTLGKAHAAPKAFATWASQRQSMRQACERVPSDQVVLVGDTTMEAEWARSGGLASFLTSDRYFGTATS